VGEFVDVTAYVPDGASGFCLGAVAEVARRVGYASATVLREQFVKRRGMPPRAYRHRFGRETAKPVG
jgi:AraC-like DNA-binding protein